MIKVVEKGYFRNLDESTNDPKKNSCLSKFVIFFALFVSFIFGVLIASTCLKELKLDYVSMLEDNLSLNDKILYAIVTL